MKNYYITAYMHSFSRPSIIVAILWTSKESYFRKTNYAAASQLPQASKNHVLLASRRIHWIQRHNITLITFSRSCEVHIVRLIFRRDFQKTRISLMHGCGKRTLTRMNVKITSLFFFFAFFFSSTYFTYYAFLKRLIFGTLCILLRKRNFLSYSFVVD